MKPLHPLQIKPGIYWVGALNPDLRRFDVIMETEFGTSYNAYLVVGEEKTALIDCVKDGFLEESLALIRQVIDPKNIDYIILQHTEPDHSGSVAELMQICDHAGIYCSKAASLNLPHIANTELPITAVKDGDTLELGNCTLTFLATPFLHWPDTMSTYHAQSGALFTCDFFGCHYTPEQVLESKTDPAFLGARRYYYDCIMSPFAAYATKAIARIKALNAPISAILPSHGPVLDQNPMNAIDLYEQWAQERKRTGKRVFIGYVTCYGYTRTLANALSDFLQAKGLEVDLVDVSEIPLEEAMERVYACDALAIGCPTVNADALPPVWALLCNLSVPLMRGVPAVAFGSYGWSGEAVPFTEQRLTSLGCKVLGTYRMRFKPTQADFEQMQLLSDQIAAALQK